MPATNQTDQLLGKTGKKSKINEKNQNSLNIPSLSLPKCGGAIKGIDEKFTANPFTGFGSMSISIAANPRRSRFGSQLSLSYDSGSRNGPFGFGRSLSLPSITRKTNKGILKYQDEIESDVFIFSGAADLVLVLVKDGDGEQNFQEIIDLFYVEY